MTWPTGSVPTSNLYAGTDNPQLARPDLLLAVQKLNQIIADLPQAARLDIANTFYGRVNIDKSFGATGDSVAALRLCLNGDTAGAFFMGYAADMICAHNSEYILGYGYIARAAVAEMLRMQAGVLTFYSDSGLTAGASYTPTPRWSVTANGSITGASAALTGINISTGGAVNSANTSTIDTNGAGGARTYSRGPNTSTVGYHEWHLASSNGSIDQTAMILDQTGDLALPISGAAFKFSDGSRQLTAVRKLSTRSSNLAGSSRVMGTTYTNSNAYPIWVAVNGNNAGSGASFLINGTAHLSTAVGGSVGQGWSLFYPVLPGETYSVNGSGLSGWFETT